MFHATMGQSSGETTVFLRHLLLVILCGWLSSNAYQTVIHKYQVSHKRSCSSWWWAHSRPKHVEIDNILRINCAPSWLYLQNYTGMHGQRSIKLWLHTGL